MRHLGIVALACATLLPGAWTPASAAPEPTVVTLRNGLRVLLAPDSSATAADVAVWYPAGTRWEPAELAGVSHLVSRLMFRGSKTVPDGGHRRRLQEAGGIVNTTNSPDGTCFWQTVPAEAVPLALRLEAERMAGLVASPAAFEGARADARADRGLRAEATPIARGLSRLFSTAFPGDAYGRSPYGEDAVLRRVTAPGVEAWRKSHYAPGGALLSVVGRFEPTATLAYVRSLFEPLPRGTVPAVPAPPAPAAGERRSWTRGATPLRLAFAGWRGPGAADPDVPALELIAAVLGAGDSRLSNALATEWRVGVYSESALQQNRDASLLWVATALAADADSSTAERVLLDEVARLAREPLPDDLFSRTRTRLVLDGLFEAQTVRARAAALGESLFEDGDTGRFGRRIEALEKLTPADVQRVAGRWLVESGRSVAWYVPAGEGR